MGRIDHAMAAAIIPNTTPQPMHNQTSGVMGPSTHATSTNEATPTAAAAATIRAMSTVAAAARSRLLYSVSLPVLELTGEG
jgi:hypothetical protein